MAWTFTHSAFFRWTPHFWSNHRTNREVENPELSHAKWVSTAFTGGLDRIAALLLLGPDLDANYAAVTADPYPWPLRSP
jgi:hypothetical protein